MYVHLGQDTVILTKEIIGIFDLDNTTVSKITRDMLRKSEENETVVPIGFEIPKTFVVCADHNQNNRVYLSPVTPATLTRRIQKKQIGSYRD